ncbi:MULTISPECIES: flagellar protein FlhE [unclassified Halomonas]|uniref:flagellar protein FlhE n=1 Tax=unclassified Halomonas TaxID=2609666 RepID=UPI00209DEB62|nr:MULTISPECIES: flagellar protein FlhE [unclassified Halomonas]MCP1314713.1 flagellar protein FlhE [Halomonas sp. 707D7]MCP1328676.1 flagellar protein FlhE [Halomonas sp. 707D4]
MTGTSLKRLGMFALAGIIWMGGALPALGGTGSWSREATGVMVAMSDRATRSQTLAPPAAPLAGGRIERVQWRFEAPPGAPLRAWLCHPERCVALSGQRGSLTGLTGLAADAPLEFRFALAPGQRPTRVQGLQVIVNYQ